MEEKKLYCNDGKICKHFLFAKGIKGNIDHLLCKKYRLVPKGKQPKERVQICIDKNSFEVLEIKGDLF